MTSGELPLSPSPPSLLPSSTSMSQERRAMGVASGEPPLPPSLRDLHATGEEGDGAASGEVGGFFSGSKPSSSTSSSGSELSSSSSSSSSSFRSKGCDGG